MLLTPRRLVVFILFLSVFMMAMKPSVDTDSFWHLRAGAWMLDNARLLTYDVFSYTRLNQPWINHSWLSQILLALTYRLGGYGGLNLFTALAIVGAFGFIYRAGQGGEYLRAFVIVLAAATSGVYWSARPQIMSLLFTAIFAYVIYDYLWREVNRLWLLPPLMLLWVNLHGGFALGMILLVVVFGGEVIKELVISNWRFVSVIPRSAKRDEESQGQPQGFLAPALSEVEVSLGMTNSKAIQLGGYGLACAIAVCLNPYGAQMLLYPFRTVSLGVLQNYIQEWQSPNFHQPSAQVFIMMLLALFAAIGFARRRLALTDFLLISTFTALALLAWRNVAAFAVIVAPILMRYADSAVAELQERHPRLKVDTSSKSTRFQFVNWLIVMVIALAVMIKTVDALSAKTNNEAIAKLAPVKAVEYLQAHPVQGKMFNAYNFGGYLIWKLYPEQLVYVDGRTDLYDDALLTEYLNTALAAPGWEETLTKYETRVVLVESESPLARALAASPQWRVVYQDPLASVITQNP